MAYNYSEDLLLATHCTIWGDFVWSSKSMAYIALLACYHSNANCHTMIIITLSGYSTLFLPHQYHELACNIYSVDYSTRYYSHTAFMCWLHIQHTHIRSESVDLMYSTCSACAQGQVVYSINRKVLA